MIARTLALATLLTTLAQAQTIQVNKENKTIAITSTDSASKPADTAEISIGFTTYGAAQDPTYADCSRISNQIMQALIGTGLHKDQIASSAQNLSPIDASEHNDKSRFDKGLRFVCSQSWKVTTPAASAAAVLHLAITSGANDSGAIDWTLADDNALQAEAAGNALEHARQIAERMAKGLNAKLGPLVYASNQEPNRLRFGGVSETVTVNAQPVIKPLAIVPDKVTRTATVYAVFAIE